MHVKLGTRPKTLVFQLLESNCFESESSRDVIGTRNLESGFESEPTIFFLNPNPDSRFLDPNPNPGQKPLKLDSDWIRIRTSLA